MTQGERNPFLDVLYLLCAAWFGIAGWDYLSHARWLNKLRYSAYYGVNTTDVNQGEDKPPSDCDFFRAPIGLKGCHYDKTVTYAHVITSHDTATNRPIVSFDEGKTWSWNDGDYPTSSSKSVYIYWQKIDEDKTD
jgi:diadenosine tetraphosphatase ApaH/serine/threonine PP2A family protein phosphatase